LKHLLFFPAPYPDEILYSVLCRYHIRCGVPDALHTNLALWGNRYGKKLFLPDNIEYFAAKIPLEANLAAEHFMEHSTILPLLKPFLPQRKYDELVYAAKFGDSNIHNMIGFCKIFTLQHRYLRYCPECVENDAKICGEPYWRRIHQLPGAYLCPTHGVTTAESDIEYDDLRNNFYPLPLASDAPAALYEPGIAAKLLNLARDMAWSLHNGYALRCLEHTDELYDNRLRVKGYRDHNGKTSAKRLAQDIVDYYGREFLEMFDAYNSGVCMWVKRIIERNHRFRHPLYHLMLVRFLSGSASSFFTNTQEKPPKYLPFGAPPYPCRNYICEEHLQDVIEEVELTRVNATPRAVFVCPHCGFSYRRSGKTAKEKQYSGQIDVTDYGWKWEKSVTTRLTTGESPYKIARDCHCDVRTILAFGVERGLLPAERRMERKPYIPVDSPMEKPDFEAQRELYRQRWRNMIDANRKITRKELLLLDGTANQWLHLHDSDWLEQNSPPSKKSIPSWSDRDDEYFGKVKSAVEEIRNYAGKPKRICIMSVGKSTGIVKPYIRFMSELLPKTKAFVAANVETTEQFHRRKIIWAVRQMRGRGEIITVYKVRNMAGIKDKKRRLDDFIAECIHNSE